MFNSKIQEKCNHSYQKLDGCVLGAGAAFKYWHNITERQCKENCDEEPKCKNIYYCPPGKTPGTLQERSYCTLNTKKLTEDDEVSKDCLGCSSYIQSSECEGGTNFSNIKRNSGSDFLFMINIKL